MIYPANIKIGWAFCNRTKIFLAVHNLTAKTLLLIRLTLFTANSFTNACIMATGKNSKKENLPFKICLHCNRPYSWRKKWKNNWDEVKYCSDKCRKNKNQQID